MGLSYSLNDNTSVYAVYDEAFLPQAGATYDGKPFDPVVGDNKEIGLKKEWLNGMWTASLAAYRITRNNVLTADPEHQYFSIQFGQTQTQGIEFDVRGQLLHGLNVAMNYAYTDGKVTEDTDGAYEGTQIPGTDRHIANAWLQYKFPFGALEGLGLSFGVQHAAGRTAWYGAYDRSVDPTMPACTRFDAAVSYQFGKMGVAINANNLFDAELISGAYYTWSHFYYWQAEALRNYRFTVSYRF